MANCPSGAAANLSLNTKGYGPEMFMLARPRRSVLYMPGSNAKALAKAEDAACRRADPRSRGFGRPRSENLRARTGRRGGARRRASAGARSSSASTGRIRRGEKRISSPPPPPARTPFSCPRSTGRGDHGRRPDAARIAARPTGPAYGR